MSQTEHAENGVDRAGTAGVLTPASAAGRVDDQGNPIDEGSDIDFTCPHCDHPMVINVRGAGLTVVCTDCGELVQVPIPEGMEITDLDETPEHMFAQIVHLRRDLSHADDRIIELERVVSSLMERRTTLERARLSSLHRCVEMGTLLHTVLRNQNEITAVVQRIQALLAEEEK
jgi:uncharacterized Zn finger protein (UPF0148 family)